MYFLLPSFGLLTSFGSRHYSLATIFNIWPFLLTTRVNKSPICFFFICLTTSSTPLTLCPSTDIITSPLLIRYPLSSTSNVVPSRPASWAGLPGMTDCMTAPLAFFGNPMSSARLGVKSEVLTPSLGVEGMEDDVCDDDNLLL